MSNSSNALSAPLRPGSMDVRGQQPTLFPFDAFVFDDPNRTDEPVLTMRPPWKLAVDDVTADAIQAAMVNAELIVVGFQGTDPDNPVEGDRRLVIKGEILALQVYDPTNPESNGTGWIDSISLGGFDANTDFFSFLKAKGLIRTSSENLTVAPGYGIDVDKIFRSSALIKFCNFNGKAPKVAETQFYDETTESTVTFNSNPSYYYASDPITPFSMGTSTDENIQDEYYLFVQDGGSAVTSRGTYSSQVFFATRFYIPPGTLAADLGGIELVEFEQDVGYGLRIGGPAVGPDITATITFNPLPGGEGLLDLAVSTNHYYGTGATSYSQGYNLGSYGTEIVEGWNTIACSFVLLHYCQGFGTTPTVGSNIDWYFDFKINDQVRDYVGFSGTKEKNTTYNKLATHHKYNCKASATLGSFRNATINLPFTDVLLLGEADYLGTISQSLPRIYDNDNLYNWTESDKYWSLNDDNKDILFAPKSEGKTVIIGGSVYGDDNTLMLTGPPGSPGPTGPIGPQGPTGNYNIDGGAAGSIYLPLQNIDGGGA